MSSVHRVLILCKTYPSPSSKHAETSCVAGMTEDGRMVRLYPEAGPDWNESAQTMPDDAPDQRTVW